MLFINLAAEGIDVAMPNGFNIEPSETIISGITVSTPGIEAMLKEKLKIGKFFSAIIPVMFMIAIIAISLMLLSKVIFNFNLKEKKVNVEKQNGD